MLREHAERVLSNERLRELTYDPVALQTLGNEASARRVFARYLDAYLHGHEEQLAAFVRRNVEPQLAKSFAAELRVDAPASNRAWRAFQQLVLGNLLSSIEELGLKQVALITQLEEWRSSLTELELERRDSKGVTGLDQIVATSEEQIVASMAEQFGRQQDEVRGWFKVTFDVVAMEAEQTRSESRADHDQTRAVVRETGELLSAEFRQRTDDIRLQLAQHHGVEGSAQSTPARERFPITNLPHLRNLRFSGREDLLSRLHGALASPGDSSVRPTQVLHGLGGVGKTQLANEFARRYADDYDVRWWVRAGTQATIAADMAALASHLGLVDSNSPIEEGSLAAVIWLQRGSARWLLIFDDAEEPTDLREWHPESATGHVIVTSRNPNWSRSAETVKVSVFSAEHSVDFLARRTGRDLSKDDHEYTAALAVAAELDGLPLALEQAAAVVEQTGMSFAEYLRLFRERRLELQEIGSLPSDEYGETVLTTWLLAFDRLRDTKGASELLTLCAFFAPDSIPTDMLFGSAVQTREAPHEVLNDDLQRAKAIVALRRYSLAEVTDGWTLSIHRLVQMATRHNLTEVQYPESVASALRLVANAFPGDPDNPDQWKTSERLLGHAFEVIEHALPFNQTAPVVAQLSFDLGQYLWVRGNPLEAARLLSTATEQFETERGPDDPGTATGLRGLAYALRDLGQLAAAGEKAERALRIDESALGKESVLVAEDLAILGTILRSQGHLAASRDAHERALHIHEKVLGDEHRDVATDLNNLAAVLQDLGLFAEARKRLERAVQIHEGSLGRNHREVATDLGNLGHVLMNLGLYREARSCLLRSLAINRGIFGRDHLRISINYNLLSRLLHETGKLRSACVSVERSLAILERVHGPNHPDVATELNNSGQIYMKMGDFAEAERRYQRALEIRQASPDKNPLMFSTDLNNLAHYYIQQREFALARDLLVQAVAIAREYLPLGHPKVAANQLNLGWALEQLGEVSAALEQYIAALQGWQLRNAANPEYQNLHAEAECLYALGLCAQSAGKETAGLDLLAACYILERLAGQSAAEVQVMPEIRRVARDLGLDELGIQRTVSRVERELRRDRGRRLVEALGVG
jgi:tetratricopeptide (TPR) repeat protein